MHCGAPVGKAGATKETLEETEHEEACKVFDQSGWDGEDEEDEKGDGVDWTPADDWDFTERCKNQWAYAVGEDVEGERERCIGWGDAKFFDDAGFTRGVDCGAGVDGEGVGADYQGHKEALAVGPILWVCCIVRCVPVNEDVAI